MSSIAAPEVMTIRAEDPCRIGFIALRFCWLQQVDDSLIPHRPLVLMAKPIVPATTIVPRWHTSRSLLAPIVLRRRLAIITVMDVMCVDLALSIFGPDLTATPAVPLEASIG
jgi:hypothetical protein